jgi:4-carboxymuconolactone decarboxylase
MNRQTQVIVWSTVSVLLSLAGPLANAQDRMPPIPAARMTDEQNRAVAEFRTARQSEPSGPFVPLLRSPEVMMRTRAMGDYLRYKSALPPRLSEFVILLTSRQWAQQYEWNAHYAIALQAGVNPETLKAVAQGRRPEKMAEDEDILYDFCMELQHNQNVSDANYRRAVTKFGEKGVIDTVGIVGYYTMLAMVLNTARTPLPPNAKPALAPLSHSEEEVRQVEKQFNEARARADTATLNKILADGWTITHGDGSSDTKAKYLSDLSSGARKFDFVTQDEFSVRFYGDTAIAAGFTDSKVSYNGAPQGGRLRFTRVYEKHDGTWQMIVSHATRVAP